MVTVVSGRFALDKLSQLAAFAGTTHVTAIRNRAARPAETAWVRMTAGMIPMAERGGSPF